ncbi:hypothetical protein [Sorangium sp. So ce1335]|uniref:hypothetical protein n=1 Tax=Sorangium sp. So ce1335 TaxID=3133335 RepID=UPI003F5D591B
MKKLINVVRQALGRSEAQGSAAAPATTGAPVDIEHARVGLTAAERDTAETGARLAERETVLATAEASFDVDPSDANGAAVITARNARDLAKLQADRAGRREQQARAALAQAEHEAQRARLEAELGRAERRHHAVLEAERRARAARLAAHPAQAILEAIRSAEERQRQATAEHDETRAALDASAVELAALEAQVQAIAPERAEELRARAEDRTSEVRDALAGRASLAAAKARILPSVDLILAAEALIRRYLAEISGVVDEAREDARGARALGASDIKPLDDFHKTIHVFHGQFMALPEQAKQWNDHLRDLEYRCGMGAPRGATSSERGYRFNMHMPSQARLEGVVPSTRETIQAILDSATETDAQAALDAIITRIRAENAERERRTLPTQSTAGQTPDDRPPGHRGTREIMGDYLPCIGGIIAPGFGRRAS